MMIGVGNCCVPSRIVPRISSRTPYNGPKQNNRLSQKKGKPVTGALATSGDAHNANGARASDLVTAKDETAVELPPRMLGSKIAKLKSSGPNGLVEPYTLIRDPSAWYAADFTGKEDDYIFSFTSDHIRELEAEMANIKKRDIAIQDICKDDYVLPTLNPILEALGNQVAKGRGFQVLRGLPVDSWGKRDTMVASWIIALHWGPLLCQNRNGAMVDHVKTAPAVAAVKADPGRPQHTDKAHGFHTDRAPWVMLVCLAQAPEGGLSSWCSSSTVHNELLLRGKEQYVKLLAEGTWPQDRRGDLAPGGVQGAPWFCHPVFSYEGGHLTTVFPPHLIKMSERWEDAPRISAEQREALATVTALAASEELRMSMLLQPGDMQVLNNYTNLHARSTYKDGSGPGEQRHLIRLWVSPRADRPVPPEYANYSGSLEPGRRGGIVPAPGTYPHVPLDI